jgi:hypothetical protein
MRRVGDFPAEVERQRYEAQQEAAAALENAASSQNDFLGRNSQEADKKEIKIETHHTAAEKANQVDSSKNVYERFAAIDAEFHAQMEKVHSMKDRGEDVSDEDQLKLRKLHEAAMDGQKEIENFEKTARKGESQVVENPTENEGKQLPVFANDEDGRSVSQPEETNSLDENDPVKLLAAASERFAAVNNEFHTLMEEVDAAKKRGEVVSAEDQSKLHNLNEAARTGQRDIDRLTKLVAAKKANSADAKQMLATAKAHFDEVEQKFVKLKKVADDARARGDELDDVDKNNLKEAQENARAAHEELSDLRSIVEGTGVRHDTVVSENGGVEKTQSAQKDDLTQVEETPKARLEREQSAAAKAKREAEEALEAVARAKQKAEALQKEAEEQALLWAAEKQRSHQVDREVKMAKQALKKHHKKMKSS